jgi:hypothetical protein
MPTNFQESHSARQDQYCLCDFLQAFLKILSLLILIWVLTREISGLINYFPLSDTGPRILLGRRWVIYLVIKETLVELNYCSLFVQV